MEEIQKIWDKYDEDYVTRFLDTPDDLNTYAGTFYRDATEILDAITRARNMERNPKGFTIDDAPILGLLVRTWKLLKEVIRYYEHNNAELIGLLERPVLESATTATYLLRGDAELLDDYRKCSYKDRLRILRDMEKGSPFFETKAGKRLLASVQDKLAFENLTVEDFQVQRKNRWRIQGMSFYEIFGKIHHQSLYACTYGMMSDSIHGSWNESMDYDLTKDQDGWFMPYPFYQPADIRFVTPLLHFCIPPYLLWLQRIDCEDEYLLSALNWIEKFNTVLFHRFDNLYDG